MEEMDHTCDYQNSRITGIFYTYDVKERFYRRIEDIWDLDYYGEKVSMFCMRWAKNFVKECRYFTTMVTPEAKSKSAGVNVTTKNKPWVMASKVDHCFFITDP